VYVFFHRVRWMLMGEVGACAAAGKFPPPGWTNPDESGKAVSVSDVSRFGESTISHESMSEYLSFIDLGTLHSVGLPIHVYPLYENAFRAHRGQSMQENNQESAELYADFAKVAEQNPVAWNFGRPAATEEIIGTVSKKNRMICFPCTCTFEFLEGSNAYRSSFDERIQQCQFGGSMYSDFD
jgi:hypothetical protein